MQCVSCRHANLEGEHRCGRCGRRLSEAASFIAPVHRTTGNLATAAAVAPIPEPAPAREMPARQRSLFPEARVIPFESFAPRSAAQKPEPETHAAVAAAPARPPGRPSTHRVSDRQSSLDFLAPAPASPRRLKTSVEAVIYCDAPVATLRHRAIASALDGGIILAGFGLFLAVFHLLAGGISLDSRTAAVFLGAFALIAGLYGLVWVLAARETAGMRWVQLRLIDFDGFPPDMRSRIIRYAGSWLSFCTVGTGLLWALVDEESLTWQDHMSRTFPTMRESDSSFRRA